MLLNLLTPLYQFILFIFYFVYFLFKGKPEWKKLDDSRNTSDVQGCCLHNKDPDACKSFHLKKEEHTFKPFNATFTTTTTNVDTSPITEKRGRIATIAANGRKLLQRLKIIFYEIGYAIYYVISLVLHIVFWIVKLLAGFLFWSSEKTPANGSVAQNLQSSFNEEKLNNLTKSYDVGHSSSDANELMEKQKQSGEPAPTGRMDAGESDERFDATSNIKLRYRYETAENNEPKFTGPPPPPPIPPTFPTWKITVTSSDEITKHAENEAGASEGTPTEKVLPGAVPVLPPEITAEASMKIREREKKLETHKEDITPADRSADDWTVTSTRKVTEIKSRIPETLLKDYPVPAERISLQSSANSQNLPSYKYENVFAKPFHPERPISIDTTQHDYRQTGPLTDDPFLMGRSVFSPLREAEEIRSSINRKAMRSESVTRIETPTNYDAMYASSMPYTSYGYTSQSSRATTPHDKLQNTAMSYYSQRSRPPNRMPRGYAYTPSSQDSSHFSSDQNGSYVRHRSHTTEPRSSRNVSNISRNWPPKSNATGVEITKDIWNIPQPSNITSCRRVMERSVTDKWLTRDDTGRLIDEYAERSWKGESDGMRYRPDGTGEAWHSSVSVNPLGRTTFVDNKSHFNRDYVIQSEVRNA